MPDPGHPWFDLIAAGLLTCPSCNTFPPGRAVAFDCCRTRLGLTGLTATGLVPDLHRIPFSRTHRRYPCSSHRNPMQIYIIPVDFPKGWKIIGLLFCVSQEFKKCRVCTCKLVHVCMGAYFLAQETGG